MTNQRSSLGWEKQLAREGGGVKTSTTASDDRRTDTPTVQYNGLKEMLQQQNGAAVRKLPAPFVLPPHLQPGLSAKGDPRVANLLPLIDMARVNDNLELRNQVVASIAKACREWGFFQVVGHGVSVALRQRMLDLGRDFFELPVVEKVKYQTGDVDLSKPVLGRSRITASGHHSVRDLFRHKTTPVTDADVEKWPTTPKSYRETVLEYTEEVKKVANTLFELIAEGLNLKSQRICEALGGEDNVVHVMMMAYYPRCPQPDLALGLIGHSDPNLITLLIEDHPGLQVRKGDCWIPVEPAPGGISVNIGDSLQIMTNNNCVSSEHRVLASDMRDRVSVMMFVQPKDDVQLGVVPDLVPSNSTALYNDIEWGLYLNHARQGLDMKLTQIALKLKLQTLLQILPPIINQNQKLE